MRFTGWRLPSQSLQIVIDQFADAFNGEVRRRIVGNGFGIQRVMALAREDGGKPVAPDVLHRRQEAQLVVHHHVVFRRITLLHVVEFLFLVNVDERVAVHGFEQAGAFHFARLEDDVAVGEDDDRSPLPDVFEGVERVRIEAVGEGIIDEEVGDDEQARVAGICDAVALERAEVVGVTEFGAQLLEEGPIVLRAFGADFAFEVAFEVGGDAVVVEQRVVHVEQEDDFVCGHGGELVGAERARFVC